MKKSCIFFIACFFVTIYLLAQNSSDDFAVSFNNGGLTIETYDGREEYVVIPSQIAGHPVRQIADCAFSGKSILGIVIPGTVISVSEKAFYGCQNLEVIEFLGVLPVDEQPFKGLSTITPPIVRHWDSSIDEETTIYRGLNLQTVWQNPLPFPIRMDNANGHLFENSLTLSFPKMAAGQVLRYQENFLEPTANSPIIANGAEKTIKKDCHLSLRVFTSDGTPLSGVTHITYGCLDNPQKLTANDFKLRLCTCQNDSGRLEIEGVKTHAPIVYLPNELDGKPVFNLCTPLAWTGSTLAIFLPDNLGQCGYSFADNRFVEYIHFSNGVHKLTSGIASGCSALSKVDLPQSIFSIGPDAFANCASLTDVILPPSLAKIGKRAFFNCRSLNSIVFPSMVQEIEEEAFAGCDNLTEVVFCGPPPKITGKVLPPSVVSIKVQPNLGWGNEFDGIPVTVLDASLGIVRTDEADGNFFVDKLEIKCEVTPSFVSLEYSLDGTSFIAYTKPFTITESSIVTVQAVVNGVKYGPAISRNFVKTTDDGMKNLFAEDTKDNTIWNLQTSVPFLALPQSLAIVDGLSSGESILQSLYIPSTTTNLAGRLPMSGAQAVNPVAGVQTLKEIIVNPDNSSFKVINGVLFDADVTTLLSYPPAHQDNVYEIPAGVQYIAAEAFACANNLEAIILPESVVSIGKGAFRNMAKLSEMEFPQKLCKISMNACLDCVSLTHVVLPIMLESIERGAFMGCTSLREVNLPPFLQVVGDDAFRNCSQLEYLDIPASIELVCISALFGVHEDCRVNFNGIYSYNLPFWGNGALRDKDTDEYLLPHLVVSWWSQYYDAWYPRSAYMWQCFEEDEDAYYELISSDCNNGHTEYYQYDFYNSDSSFQYEYLISMADDDDLMEDNLCRLDFNFDFRGKVYDNLIFFYTMDGTEPNWDNGIVEEAFPFVTVYSDCWPLIFRARFYDAYTGEQMQGEINCLIQEASLESHSFTYVIDYEELCLTEKLNQKYISRGSLCKTIKENYANFSDSSEQIYGNLLNEIPMGDDIVLHLLPYQNIINLEELIRDKVYPRKINLSWSAVADEIPTILYMSDALCEADVDWSFDGDVLNASLAEINPIAREYRLKNGDSEKGNLRVKNGVLFAGDMLVAYPGSKNGESYDIPEGISSIASNAFCRNEFGLKPLRKVSVPASVDYIYDSAFSNVDHIIGIYFKGKKPMNAERLIDVWDSPYPNEEDEICVVHAFPNSGFEEEYDIWQDQLFEEEDYYWSMYWWYKNMQSEYTAGDYWYQIYQWYDTFEDYLADYPCLFWNLGSLVIEGISAPSFIVQEDGYLAIAMPEDGEYQETQGQYDIHFTTDGTQPSADSLLYEEPISMPTESCVIRAVIFHDGIPCSTVATYRVRKKHEDDAVCDDEWVLQEDVQTEDGQPVFSPPAHGAFIYRHTENFQKQDGYIVAFMWKLDSSLASMSLKVDNQLVVKRCGYTPWERILVYIEDEEEHRFDWECEYTKDAREGNLPFDMWLGRPITTPLPESYTVTLQNEQNDVIFGSYETGTSVYLLPNLYPDKKLLKWEILSQNTELINDNMIIMPYGNVVVKTHYSQYTENVILPGWNMLGNIWLFEDRELSAKTQVFIYDENGKSYVMKSLADASEGTSAFWYYHKGKTKLVPIYGGRSRASYDLKTGWHLLPGGMELPEGCSCFVFDKQRKVFRYQENCNDPSTGYWIYIP